MSSPWMRVCSRRVWDHTEDGFGWDWHRVMWQPKDYLSAVVEKLGTMWRWTLFGSTGRTIEFGDCTTEAGARRAVEKRVAKVIAARKEG